VSRRGGWIVCPDPTCRRRIFRWYWAGIEIAPGAKIMQPMDRGADEWVTRADEVAIAWCPRGHQAGPPQPPLTSRP
jgi:hypothetical protein